MDNYSTLTYNDINQLNDIAHIKSFTTDNTNLLMWSHYANYHRGICVEYDLTELEATNPILEHIFPVFYSPKRYYKSNVKPMSNELKWLRSAIAEGLGHDYEGWLNDIMALFLIKGKMWEYEREWRILYTLLQIYEEDKRDLYNFIVHFDCITGIYLGYRIDPFMEEYIIDMVHRMNSCRAPHRSPITIYKSRLQSDSYSLKYCKL